MPDHISIETVFIGRGIMNRGRDGQPKSMEIGGGLRQYISAQAWRAAMRDQENAPISDIELTGTVRSRVALQRALAAAGIKPDIAKATSEAISGTDDEGAFHAPLVLGRAEIAAIVEIARDIPDVKSAGKAVTAGLRKAIANASAAGVEAVLFGRMVTTPDLPRVDGVLSTSQAIATNPLAVTHDFFVARDDLTGSTEGTAHMGTRPFSTGTFVQRTVIDMGRMERQLPDADHAAIIAWTIKACAAAPTKLARAGSDPLDPAEDMLITVDPMPRSGLGVLETPANQTAAQAMEAMIAHHSAISGRYGAPALQVRLADVGLAGLVEAATRQTGVSRRQ